MESEGFRPMLALRSSSFNFPWGNGGGDGGNKKLLPECRMWPSFVCSAMGSSDQANSSVKCAFI